MWYFIVKLTRESRKRKQLDVKSKLVSKMQLQGRPGEFVLAIKFTKTHSEKSLEAATSDDINHKLKKKYMMWDHTELIFF